LATTIGESDGQKGSNYEDNLYKMNIKVIQIVRFQDLKNRKHSHLGVPHFFERFAKLEMKFVQFLLLDWILDGLEFPLYISAVK